MAIKITQPGEAAAAAKAGATIGRGKRAEEDRARAEREQARTDQIAAQQAARKAAMEWEQQKMLLNSQQDFAHEMRMRQADLEKEARAKEWATEKMEMASRFDFEQDEKERIRVKAEYAAGRDTLDKKKDEMPAGEYERALFRLDSIYAPKGVTEAVTGLGFDPRKEDILSQLRGEIGGPVERTTPPTQADITVSKKEGEIWMQDIKTGIYGTVPTNEVQSYIKAGTHKLATPVATPEPEPKFLSKKVGSIKDLIEHLDRPVGSIDDLLRRLGLKKQETEGFYF